MNQNEHDPYYINNPPPEIGIMEIISIVIIILMLILGGLSIYAAISIGETVETSVECK